VYHLDDWRLTQITQDHSLVAVLVETGEITKEQAHIHPQRNIITRAVGTMAHEEADYFQRRFNEGDILMACSDGLHGAVSDELLEDCLRMNQPLDLICDTLIEKALINGATDNITVALARNIGGTVV
jgi:protein phosphatase